MKRGKENLLFIIKTKRKEKNKINKKKPVRRLEETSKERI